MQELKQKNIDYKAQIEELKHKNSQLVEEKSRLIHDPVYLEKVAREKMGLVKEGEVIYRIMPMNQTK
jgi:cell division protein FtsB